MKEMTIIIFLTLNLIIGGSKIGHTHSETSTLILKDWLKKNFDIKDIGMTEVVAKCRKLKNYNEIILGKANIEFNQHKKNKYNSDNHLDKFSITLYGWINSFGIRTTNYDVFWHGKPKLLRWNTNHFIGSVVTKKLFNDISQQGQFRYYLQPNPIRKPKFISVTGIVKVSNPEIFTDCFN